MNPRNLDATQLCAILTAELQFLLSPIARKATLSCAVCHKPKHLLIRRAMDEKGLCLSCAYAPVPLGEVFLGGRTHVRSVMPVLIRWLDSYRRIGDSHGTGHHILTSMATPAEWVELQRRAGDALTPEVASGLTTACHAVKQVMTGVKTLALMAPFEAKDLADVRTLCCEIGLEMSVVARGTETVDAALHHSYPWAMMTIFQLARSVELASEGTHSFLFLLQQFQELTSTNEESQH